MRLYFLACLVLLFGCTGDLTPFDVAQPPKDGTPPPPPGDFQPPTLDGPVVPDDVGVSCDRGVYLNGYCWFLAGLNFMDYPAAKVLCTTAGGLPASIHSQEENDLIFNQLFKIRDEVWIGLKRSGSGYVWDDGSPLDYTNWAPGEPGSRDCAYMAGPWADSSIHGKWKDARCDNDYQEIICKKKP